LLLLFHPLWTLKERLAFFDLMTDVSAQFLSMVFMEVFQSVIFLVKFEPKRRSESWSISKVLMQVFISCGRVLDMKSLRTSSVYEDAPAKILVASVNLIILFSTNCRTSFLGTFLSKFAYVPNCLILRHLICAESAVFSVVSDRLFLIWHLISASTIQGCIS